MFHSDRGQTTVKLKMLAETSIKVNYRQTQAMKKFQFHD